MDRPCTESLPEFEDLDWLSVRRVPRHSLLDATAIEVLHTANHYRGVIDGLNLHAAVEGRARAYMKRGLRCGVHMTCMRVQMLGSMQSAVTCRPSSMGDSWRARPWLQHLGDVISIAVSLTDVMVQIYCSMWAALCIGCHTNMLESVFAPTSDHKRAAAPFPRPQPC